MAWCRHSATCSAFSFQEVKALGSAVTHSHISSVDSGRWRWAEAVGVPWGSGVRPEWNATPSTTACVLWGAVGPVHPRKESSWTDLHFPHWVVCSCSENEFSFKIENIEIALHLSRWISVKTLIYFTLWNCLLLMAEISFMLLHIDLMLKWWAQVIPKAAGKI